MQSVQLKPFEVRDTQDIKIFVEFDFSKGILLLVYRLVDPSGIISDLEIEESKVWTLDNSSRADNLWKSTCLEFFVKPREGKNYFEFNSNSQGQWNLYSFSDYRTSMQLEFKVSEVKMTTSFKDFEKIFRYEIDLNSLFALNDSLLFSFSSVIKQGSLISYWAHRHSFEKPDFHHLNNFTIEAKFK